MIEKYFRFSDGHEVRLVDISYSEMMESNLWYGSSDVCYAAYKRANKMYEVTDFDMEERIGGKIIFKINGIEVKDIDTTDIDDQEEYYKKLFNL